MLRLVTVLLAPNKSVGYRWSPIRKPPPRHFDRLYGTHSVLHTLRVFATATHNINCSSSSSSNAARIDKEGTSEPGVDTEGAHPNNHPLHPHRRRINCLYVRDFSIEDAEKNGSDAGRGRKKKKVIPSHFTALHRITALAKSIEVPVRFVPRSELVDLCGERRNQNVVLEVSSYEPRAVKDGSFLFDAPSPPTTSEEALVQQQQPTTSPSVSTPVVKKVVLVLDRIIDPTNVGSILRTAYFYGVDDVVLSQDCAACTPVVARTSTGFLESMRVYRATVPIADFIAATKKVASEKGVDSGVGLEVIASTAQKISSPALSTSAANDATDSSISNVQAVYRLILLGNEDKGLPQAVVDECTHVVHIRCPRHERLRQALDAERSIEDDNDTNSSSVTELPLSDATSGIEESDHVSHAADASSVLEQRARSEAKLRRTMPREVSLNVNTACATLLCALAGGGAEVVLQPRA